MRNLWTQPKLEVLSYMLISKGIIPSAKLAKKVLKLTENISRNLPLYGSLQAFVLDRVLGPEEEMEYQGTTTPS